MVIESSKLLDSFSKLECDMTSFWWYDKLKIYSWPTWFSEKGPFHYSLIKIDWDFQKPQFSKICCARIIFDSWREYDQIISPWTKRKNKIIRKPRPAENKIKNISDASSHIVMNRGLYEGKELMAYKTHVKEYGATTATGQFHENMTPVIKFKSLWSKTYWYQ